MKNHHNCAKMNLSDFNKATQEECTAWLLQNGTYLADRHCQGSKVRLYHLGDFYAEVFHRSWDNQVYFVKGFKNENVLKLYLHTIQLAEL
ncbi:hypothetical protein HUW51_21265 [Adhaeribacter swui]|uniref:Uncharacterized protein n=1 Tax=Adhaeribacter swui TaxID=2086471 RepID=A0A7G7GD89_9BACT|nr:hypothetical protein [Adhaeribacter swui]QNF35123.1 hypothetical protein HUW51_21265 [Adhaeribacter swui]